MSARVIPLTGNPQDVLALTKGEVLSAIATAHAEGLAEGTAASEAQAKAEYARGVAEAQAAALAAAEIELPRVYQAGWDAAQSAELAEARVMAAEVHRTVAKAITPARPIHRSVIISRDAAGRLQEVDFVG